jgi:hypothetical protein
MPKLAIYIPKKDMREIEQWRKKLNFSQVFMRALRQEIRERSRFLKMPDEQLARAAEYYRNVLMEDSNSLIEIGYKRGCAHVLDCALSPPVIRRLCRLNAAETFEPEDLEVVAEALGGQKTLARLVSDEGLDDRTHPVCRESICRGYVKGVADAWARVCEQMRSSDPVT